MSLSASEARSYKDITPHYEQNSSFERKLLGGSGFLKLPKCFENHKLIMVRGFSPLPPTWCRSNKQITPHHGWKDFEKDVFQVQRILRLASGMAYLGSIMVQGIIFRVTVILNSRAPYGIALASFTARSSK